MRFGLALKFAIPLLMALAIGFSGYLAFSIPQQSERLRTQAEQRARVVGEVFSANLRHVMLTGDGVLLESLLSDIRRLPEVEELRLFDPAGREAYPAMEPVLARAEEQEKARAALTQAHAAAQQFSPSTGSFSHLRVLTNESACRSCHPEGNQRGALLLSTQTGRSSAPESSTVPKASSSPAAALAQSVALSIRHAMLSQRANSVPMILSDLEQIPGLAAVQVFGPDGRLQFETAGSAATTATTQAVATAIRSRRDAAWSEDSSVSAPAPSKLAASLTVLENDRLCHACHSPGDAVRGVVVARTMSVANSEQNRLENRLMAASLAAGIRNIMLSGKGSAVQRYVERFRELPGVERLHVFDPAGQEIYRGARARRSPTPPSVFQVLKSGNAQTRFPISPKGKQLVQLQALPNEEKCQRCHGKEDRYRGVIMSSVSLAGIERDIGDTRSQSLVSLALTMLLVCLLLVGVVAKVIVRPLRAIGSVAERVGEGDLDVRADWHSHDEIGQLATRMNQMIGGLRAKLHMEKFVPPSAVTLIEESSGRDRLALGGERREVTILFTDIRGFTAFSEQVEPEAVIALVNASLEQQARLVREHGGEVDKFLGDAVMAVFVGPSMAQNAVRCALAIRDALTPTHPDPASATEAVPAPGRAVGIGINTGWAVRGTVGSPDRMEFTVLGDSVNVSKRLCDIAAPNEILISATTYELVKDEVIAEASAPLPVKGRREPVAAYRLLRAVGHDANTI